MKKIRDRVVLFLYNITPRIDNLPQVVYIRWLGYEWVIPKC